MGIPLFHFFLNSIFMSWKWVHFHFLFFCSNSYIFLSIAESSFGGSAVYCALTVCISSLAACLLFWSTCVFAFFASLAACAFWPFLYWVSRAAFSWSSFNSACSLWSCLKSLTYYSCNAADFFNSSFKLIN